MIPDEAVIFKKHTQRHCSTEDYVPQWNRVEVQMLVVIEFSQAELMQITLLQLSGGCEVLHELSNRSKLWSSNTDYPFVLYQK